MFINADKPNLPAILGQGTQISVLRLVEGLEKTASIVGLLINDFCSNFNTRYPMSAEQIADLAIELITDYWTYKLEDFIVFFSLARRGVYGKVYDRVDASVILGMLGVYHKQRDEELYLIQTRPLEPEKQPRQRPDPENDGFTKIAGAMQAVKGIATMNKEQINRLDPKNKKDA